MTWWIGSSAGSAIQNIGRFGKPLPAYGFYVRHADDVRFENVKLRWAGGDEEREPVVQDDCRGVTFTKCDFQPPVKAKR